MHQSILLTVDVETDWGGRASPQRTNIQGVKNCLPRILACFADCHVRATFFISASIVKYVKEEIRTISKTGHEIASHGNRHCNYATLSETELFEEMRVSKDVLESALSCEIKGFRSPQFRLHPRHFESLGETGYLYDSSIVLGHLPFRYRNTFPETQLQKCTDSGIVPVPLIPISRIPPGLLWIDKIGLSLYRRAIRKIQNDYFIVYMHPFDFLVQRGIANVSLSSIWYRFKLNDPDNVLYRVINVHKQLAWRTLTLHEYASRHETL